VVFEIPADGYYEFVWKISGTGLSKFRLTAIMSGKFTKLGELIAVSVEDTSSRVFFNAGDLVGVMIEAPAVGTVVLAMIYLKAYHEFDTLAPVVPGNFTELTAKGNGIIGSCSASNVDIDAFDVNIGATAGVVDIGNSDTTMVLAGDDITIGSGAGGAVDISSDDITFGTVGGTIDMIGSFMGTVRMWDLKAGDAGGKMNSGNNIRYLNDISTFGSINCTLTVGSWNGNDPTVITSYFTLAAGSYWIHATVPGYMNVNSLASPGRSQAWLYQKTSPTGNIIQSGNRTFNNGNYGVNVIMGHFTITVSTQFQLVQYHARTDNTGGGRAVQTPNLYTDMTIHRLF